MALKIWRYDPLAGERALREYEVDAPDWATLLDCLDIVKDQHDGSLAYRKSCRMMICGSCGMRMDGAAVLACKTRMYDIARVRARSRHLGDGEHADRQGPRRRHGAVLGEDPRGPAVAPAGLLGSRARRSTSSRRSEMDVIHKESLCIMCGCCVSECNSMEADPDFLGPAALAKGMRFVGDARDQATVERLQAYSERARDLGLHALLLLPGALPEGRRPARRDREARRRGDARRGSTPTWARSTRSGSSPRRRRRAGCARPSSCRRRRASPSR